ncbi:hypothetical protein DOTSEDRAFT_176366 [Dothistroma septosporum NZE10]|uniref:Multicopper oxidase n=1 Tax=Dothistroma septosporum (strain NZE10 / CBS 128990) TaxID=675120 RepID=N1PGQ3_DOTSN|nr:hypothetical protein DOTSEDRAFT_176366 [Dothistroma septosporum NZE10]
MPDTGVVRRYDWTVRRQIMSPDGVAKEGVFINGQYPGPLLEANWGDWFEVTLHNGLDDEGTTIHWHGLLQKETPWYDGVPGTSQCPVAPGRTFTYRFRADQYGTSWYHSHYSAQYSDGAFGPMIIYGPNHVEYDLDIGPVIINDYYHDSYVANLEAAVGKRDTPSPDNNLINGKMNFDCSQVTNGQKCVPNAGVSKFKFRSGKKMRLRLMNTGAEGLQRFTIDEHTMTIVANDFVPVKPYQVTSVTLGVGQRTDIIVEGTGRPDGVYWMRSEISRLCGFPKQPYALAAIYYERANTNATPNSTATPVKDNNCGNDALTLTQPFYQVTRPSQPSITTRIDMTNIQNATGDFVWVMNNSSFRADWSDSVLADASRGETQFPAHDNVYRYSRVNERQSIRLVLYSIAAPLPHPMHLHGHNYWVLAEGYGEWNGTITNPQNPQMRDVQLMDRAISPTGATIATTGGSPGTPYYIVLEFLADNPGLWPMHCHIAWHLAGGMYINVLERPEDLHQYSSTIQSVTAETCPDWKTYNTQHNAEELGSGE